MNDTSRSRERLLTFITTDVCTARCASCLMRSGPGATDTLRAEDMIRVFDQVLAERPPTVVVFSGGEPTTLGDDLLEAIAHVSLTGVMTRIVTNAGWASDTEAARSMVEVLRGAGLAELNVSTDDFHARWISPDHVVNAWRASRGAGFTSVVVNVGEGPRSRITAERVRDVLGSPVPDVVDDAEKILPEPDPDGTRYFVVRSRLSRLGRGASLRTDYLSPPLSDTLPGGACDLVDPGSVVTAGGRVAVCCGSAPGGNPVLSGGDVTARPWAPAVAELGADVVVRGLRELGPGPLWELAESWGCTTLTPRPPYGNLCEVCEQLTTSPEAVRTLRRNAAALDAVILFRRSLAATSSLPPAQGESHVPC
ncbi:MAG: hypothetical protein QG622_2697 [Actinomycetota bacterium]|nr:hypothetical protein [Actinomycetota bacterium]